MLPEIVDAVNPSLFGPFTKDDKLLDKLTIT
jgi:hypothetical protein